MFYSLYIKLQTNLHLLKLELPDQEKVIRFIKKSIIEDDNNQFQHTVLDNDIETMFESNGCLHMQYVIKLNNSYKNKDSHKENRQFYRDTLPLIFNNEINTEGVSVDINIEKSRFGCSTNTLLIFQNIESKGYIKSLDDIPSKTTKINFIGYMPDSPSDLPKIDIEFFDKNNSQIEDSTKWIKSFQEEYSRTFSATDASYVLVKYVLKMLFGNDYENTIKNLFQSQEMTFDTYGAKHNIESKYYKETTVEECRIFLD